MRSRYSVMVLVVLLTFIAAGWAAARGSDGAVGEGAASETEQDRYIGLRLDEAITLAETEQRTWRIAREDDTDFALTDDLDPGRITFEVDHGIVSSAQIERADTTPPEADGVTEDPVRAELLAAAVLRIVTLDNSFEDADVFDDVRVARLVGSTGESLEPLDLEVIASTLEGTRSVRFIDDADTEINALLEAKTIGVAIVAVERVDVLDERAEVKLSLWCGSLCGVYLTYEAVASDAGWSITGTIGPIAVS